MRCPVVENYLVAIVLLVMFCTFHTIVWDSHYIIFDVWITSAYPRLDLAVWISCFFILLGLGPPVAPSLCVSILTFLIEFLGHRFVVVVSYLSPNRALLFAHGAHGLDLRLVHVAQWHEPNTVVRDDSITNYKYIFPHNLFFVQQAPARALRARAVLVSSSWT
jgi:hypothetical protein